MTLNEVRLLDADDIQGILVTCNRQSCGASVRILMATPIPENCPCCNKPFSIGSRNAAREIQAFVREAKHGDTVETVQLWVGC